MYKRQADHLQGTSHLAAADQARFEAAITYVAAADPISATLGFSAQDGDSVRVAEGVEVLRVSHAVTEPEPVPLAEPITWVIWCGADGDVRLLEVSDAAAALITDDTRPDYRLAELPCDEDEIALLCGHGVFVPNRWRLGVLPE